MFYATSPRIQIPVDHVLSFDGSKLIQTVFGNATIYEREKRERRETNDIIQLYSLKRMDVTSPTHSRTGYEMLLLLGDLEPI